MNIHDVDSVFMQLTSACNNLFGNGPQGILNSSSAFVLCLVVLSAVVVTITIQPPLKNTRSAANQSEKTSTGETVSQEKLHTSVKATKSRYVLPK